MDLYNNSFECDIKTPPKVKLDLWAFPLHLRGLYHKKGFLHILKQKGDFAMQNCEFVTMISVLACQIAKDKTPEELTTLSAFFCATSEIH